MSSFTNPDEHEVPTIVGRRSTRLSMIIPIAIKGTSAEGQAFRENTWTIGINKQGARIASFHKLTVGDEIVIENPLLGHTARARVIRVGEKRFPEDPYEVGVELLEARNVWGVKFPPEDWKAGAAAATLARERASIRPAAPEPGARSPEPARAEKDTTTPAPPEKSAQFSMAIEALSQLAKKSEEMVPAETDLAAPPASEESGPGKPAGEAAETAAKPPAPAEREVGPLAEQVSTARQELDGLAARLQEFRESWGSEAERIRQQAERAATQGLAAALDEARERVKRDAEAAAWKSVDDARLRLEEEANRSSQAFRETAAQAASRVLDEQLAGLGPMLDAMVATSAGRVKDEINKRVEELAPELKDAAGSAADRLAALHLERASQTLDEKVAAASDRLRANLEELVAKRLAEFRESQAVSVSPAVSAQASDEAAKALVQQTNNAVASLNAATEEARQKLEAAVRGLEGDLEGKMGEFRQLMGDASGTALDGFRNYLADMARSFEEQLQRSAGEHRSRASADAVAEVRKFAAESLEGIKSLFQRQADDCLQLFNHQLSSSGQKHVEQIQARLAEFTRAADDQLSEGAAKLEAQRVQLEERAQKVTEETGRLLAGAAEVTAGSLRQAVQQATEEYRNQLNRTLEDSVTRSTRDLDGFFTRVVETRREAVAVEVQKQADEAVARAMGEMRGRAETTAKEATDQVLKQIGLATLVLKDWGDQATARLDAMFRNSLEAFKTQVETTTRTAMEEQRKRSAKTTNDLLSRLKHAAQALESGSENS